MPDPRSRAYDEARSAFDQLETEDKTAFVLEATFATIGQAIDETGRWFARTVENVTSEDFWQDTFRAHPADGPGAAEPATAKQTSRRKAPSGSKKSAARKTTAKKTTKRTPRKKKDDE